MPIFKVHRIILTGFSRSSGLVLQKAEKKNHLDGAYDVCRKKIRTQLRHVNGKIVKLTKQHKKLYACYISKRVASNNKQTSHNLMLCFKIQCQQREKSQIGKEKSRDHTIIECIFNKNNKKYIGYRHRNRVK